VIEQPYVGLIALPHVIAQHFPPVLTISRNIDDISLHGFDVLHFRQILFHEFGQLLDSHLEIRLIVFEYIGLVALLEVIGERIGIHQGLPTVAQRYEGLVQELDLNPCHVPELQLIHFEPNLRVLLLLAVETLLMIMETRPVMDVPLEPRPRCLSLFALFEFITTRLISVFRPIGQTDPTELVFALLVTTRHVITATVLLDGSLTFGAFLSV